MSAVLLQLGAPQRGVHALEKFFAFAEKRALLPSLGVGKLQALQVRD